ncbi:hypothetical protein B0H19DRAFT_1244587 [Mycena capillaripes]|nr:hypothetical protein B0H19DRAFT_1244587 [Mycena capillaripes]
MKLTDLRAKILLARQLQYSARAVCQHHRSDLSAHSRTHTRIRHLHARHIGLRHRHNLLVPPPLPAPRPPMIFLPRSLSNIADARNALGHLKAVFNAQTLNEVPFKIYPAQEYALDAKGVSFGWESTMKEEEVKGKGKGRKKAMVSEKEKEKIVEAGEEPEEERPFQVQNITMRMPRGTLAGVVGRVGAGKSSLMQGLMKEMPCLGGELSFGGGVAYSAQTAWIQTATVLK